VPPVWIDTHAHLDDDRFQNDLPAVLEHARSAGVICTVTVAVTAASSAACVQLAASHASLYASVGIQPNHVAQEPASAWDDVLGLVDHVKVVAVGETGLDRYWNHTPMAMQEDFFARHLVLGRAKNLAVIIHCRDAAAEVVRMLRADFDRHGPIKAVMHSFTADEAVAKECLAMGLSISFAGMLTYKNAQDLRHVASTIPLDRLLVETDSPYLAPVPLRGQRNEPANVVHTGSILAAAVGVPVETLAQHTSANARSLFGLKANA
jgi:TatD DNase family protein